MKEIIKLEDIGGNNMNKYKEIINLPHHISKKHPQMSLESRAAQFAPFAALAGYSEAINETARITSKKIKLSEQEKEIIDRHLRSINKKLPVKPEVIITYFIKDKNKVGGFYITKTGIVTKIDLYLKCIYISKLKIYFDDILEIHLK